MKPSAAFRRFVRLRPSRLLRDERGSALPFIGLGIMMIMAATGTAVDMSRVQIVQSRMQNALDATGLAVGANVSTADIPTETTKYFYANFPPNYMGTTVTSLSAAPNGDNSVINLAVAGTVPTTFMRVLGINTVSVSATSQILRQSKGMELVLVIDNTGSMANSAGGSTSKIQAAKTAASTLLDTLYGVNNNTVPNLWVGLVPFSQTVNVGNGHTSWTTANSFNWGTGNSWNGCVDARETGNRDVTDDPPSVATFPQYYYPCDTNNKWYGTDSGHTNCTTSNPVHYRTGQSTTTYGPNVYCPQPVTTMVAEKNVVNTGINSMIAQGDTLIDVGLAWGWRMLSPSWRGLWGGEMNSNSLPLDYNSPLMYKVVVLMTDGDNTIDNTTRGAYWYLSNNKLGTTNSTTALNTLNSRTTQVCTSMKNNGIIIYTIALGSSISTAGRNLLSACATSSDYYFESPTTNELQAIFQQIGDSLANLRVSQ